MVESTVSIIIPCLESYEPYRRNLLNLSKVIPQGASTEVIIVDDGSDPPLPAPIDLGIVIQCPVKMIWTRDHRPWTNLEAFMQGVHASTGRNIIRAEIDHMFTREAIEWARNFTGQRANFVRKVAILDEDGEIITDRGTLLEVCEYPGIFLKFKKYVENNEFSLSPEYVIKRELILGPCAYAPHDNWPEDHVEAHYKMMELAKEFADRCDSVLDYYPGRWFSQRAPEEAHIYVDPRCSTDFFHKLERMGG